MENSKYKKGSTHSFPVTSVREENTKSFYIVDIDGKDYAVGMFPFQKNEPVPQSLKCFIKDLHEGDLVITQDIGPILLKFYENGKTYSFFVKSDYTATQPGLYEVKDSNGFYFKLETEYSQRLYVKQKVECRVKITQPKNRVELTLVDTKREKALPFYDFPTFMDKIQTPKHLAKWIERKFKIHPYFAEAYEAIKRDDAEWPIIAITNFAPVLSKWIKELHRNSGCLLDVYYKSILYILEESDFLRKLSLPDRTSYQGMLSKVAEDCEKFIQASAVIRNEKSKEYVQKLLNDLETSGYLYHPESKLRQLISIFSIDGKLMDDSMEKIFEIILKGQQVEWSVEPFRTAFIDMLELYINDQNFEINHKVNVESTEGKKLLSRVVRALAIQLLLSNSKDKIDRNLNRSRLYRLLSFFIPNSDEILRSLTDKAFTCLFSTYPEKLEFTWSEVNDPCSLALKLSYAGSWEKSGAALDYPQIFEGEKAQLRIINQNIQILPRDSSHTKKVLPDWMLDWHDMQVFLPKSLKSKVEQNSLDFKQYRTMWREVTDALFSDPHVQAPVAKNIPKKYDPEVGQFVDIIVLRQDDRDQDYFHCKIVDEHYEGIGTIYIKEIVKYDCFTSINDFRDEGRTFKLKAEVKKINKDGTLEFSLLKTISTWIEANNSYGEEKFCKLKGLESKFTVGISDYGETIIINKGPNVPEFQRGDLVRATVERVSPTGQIFCNFVEFDATGDEIDEKEAFANLLFNVNGDSYYEPGEDEEDIDDTTEESDDHSADMMMSDEYVTELIYIIDRRSHHSNEIKKTYNFLNYAYLISLILGNRELSMYYDERKKLVRMLYQHVSGEEVDLEELSRHEESLRNYPMIGEHITQLRVISCIDKPDMEDYLWKVQTESQSENILSLTKLVMANNMLSNFGMQDEKLNIRRKISEVLNINLGTMSYHFGNENQTTEFKTSIVFPPDNNLMPDLRTQTFNIMRVICGFFNSELGGTLYLGVNNEGYACGLDNDLNYKDFNGSMDKYDLYIRNYIKNTWGMEANSKVTVSFPDAGKHKVYAIAIKPSDSVLTLEGNCYLRQGTSTYIVDSAYLEKLRQTKHNKSLQKEMQQAAENLKLVEEAKKINDLTTQIASQLPEAPENDEFKANSVETNKDTTYDSLVDSAIPTSKLRNNALHEYEPGFVVPIGYIELLNDSKYQIEKDENWNETMLTLAIHEDETNGVLTIVYESGEISVVEISEIMDKTPGTSYKRSAKTPVFVSPANKEDGLLIISEDTKGNYLFRVDKISDYKLGSMLAGGTPFCDLDINRVVKCEIISASNLANFKRIIDLGRKMIGQSLSTDWASKERAELEGIGISVSEF